MTKEIAVKPTISQPDGSLIQAYALIDEKFKADYDAAVGKTPLPDGRTVKLSLIDRREYKEADREGDVRLTYTFNDKVEQQTIGRILKIDPTLNELFDLESEYAALIPDDTKKIDTDNAASPIDNGSNKQNEPGY